MAKIDKLPGIEIISSLKGKIDFYLWNGIAVARKWPRSPGHNRSPQVQAQWPAFSYTAKAWKELTPVIREAYEQMAVSTNMTGRDIFTKSYINGDFIRIIR